MGLNVYPSEDFDFVDSVQLPDLILDLFCIHREIHTCYGEYGYNIPADSLLSILFLVVTVAFCVEQGALLLSCGIHLCGSRSVGTTILVSPCALRSSGAFSFSRMILVVFSITSANAF